MALPVTVSVSLFVLVLAYCGHGFSLSDEAYYLNVIKRFDEVIYSVDQTGFLLRPFFIAVGENIFAIRVINVSVTYALCFALALMIFKELEFTQRSFLAIGVACAALTVLNGWLPSPSYNSLVPQSAMAAAIGLSLILRKERSVMGPVLVGLSGAIVFLAKPTSAMALAVLMVICLAIGGRFRLQGLAMATATAGSTVVLVAIIISGSVPAFVDRLATAYDDGVLGQSDHHLLDILRIDTMLLGWKNSALMVTTVVLVASGTWFASRTVPGRRFEVVLVAGALIFIAVCALAAPGRPWPISLAADQYWRLAPIAVASGAVICGLATCRAKTRIMDRRTLSIVVFLMLLPFVTVIGTNQNYWSAAAPASVCWTLAALRIVVSISGLRAAFPALVAAQLVAVATILIWMTSPYEQADALFEQKHQISIGASDSRLIVGSSMARYVRTLQRASATAGLSRNDAIINLTGDTPGADYVLDTELLGEVWLFGGLPGSTDVASSVLSRVPCAKLDAAWLLIAPDGPFGINPASLGIPLDRYRLVTKAMVPRLGYEPGGVEHRLLKPVEGTHLPTALCKSR